MAIQDQRGRAKNWAQLRDQMDRGETGEKVGAQDSAAAPLGTDAEAGGAITPASDIAKSAGAERAAAATGRPTGSQSSRRAKPFVLLALGLVVAGLVAVLVASL